MSQSTRARGVYREAWAIYRGHPVALLVPGAILFAIFGVPAAVLSEIHESSDVGEVLLVSGVQLLGFTTSFLYYGYCEKIAAQVRGGDEVSVERALRDTQRVLLKLIASSVVAGVLVIGGLLLLVLPGVYLAVRYALVAPASSFEHLSPRRALARSHELVRRRFRLTLCTAFAMLVVEQIVSTAGDHYGAELFANDAVGRVIGEFGGDLLVGPFAGLVVATLYFLLRDEAAVEPAQEGRRRKVGA